MTEPVTDRELVELMANGFMETFKRPIWMGSSAQDAALKIATRLGRQDIVDEIEQRKGRK